MKIEIIMLMLWWAVGCVLVGAFIARTSKRISLADALAILFAGLIWPVVFVLYWMLTGADDIEIWSRK